MEIAMRILVFYLSMVVVMMVTIAVASIWGIAELREDLKDKLDDLEEIFSVFIHNDQILAASINVVFAISIACVVIVGGVTWPKFMYTSIKEGGIL